MLRKEIDRGLNWKQIRSIGVFDINNRDFIHDLEGREASLAKKEYRIHGSYVHNGTVHTMTDLETETLETEKKQRLQFNLSFFFRFLQREEKRKKEELSNITGGSGQWLITPPSLPLSLNTLFLFEKSIYST